MFDAWRVRDEIISWIREYFSGSTEKPHAVVGISGGKDSSVAASLCAAALGADRVYGVLIPKGIQEDISCAYELVNYLKIPYCEINILESVIAIENALHTGGLNPSLQAVVNTPARVRMTVLYAVAATLNGRVVNTCNLSEDWVGYSTKFGDSAGDFSPLSRLTATEVVAVGKSLDLPDSLIYKVPVDGLSGKTDEENLGFSYAVLDRYIRHGVLDDPTLKERIDLLHRINAHKLLPMPCYEPIHFR